jgi:hypothetical protein
MKKIIIAAVLIALCTGMGTARADGLNQYIADLNANGFNVTRDHYADAWVLGLGVCVDLFNGSTITDELKSLGDASIPPDGARKLLTIAQKDLCPKTAQAPSAPVGGGIGGIMR